MNRIERPEQIHPETVTGDSPAAPLQDAGARALRAEIGVNGPEPVMDLRPERGLAHSVHAIKDTRDGFRLFRLGWTLGWLDIKLRYRGSMLGPFWMTLSTAIMVGAMGFLYAALFNINLRVYLPFLSFSLILWGYLNSAVSEGCSTFTGSVGLIHALRMPFSVHVLRVTIRGLLTFLHSAAVVAIVFVIFGIAPRLNWEAPAGVLLWLADMYAITLLFGVLGARFRDMPPVSASVMQILFFVTPIIWKPDLIFIGRQYLLLDPCYPLVEIVRGPLMNQEVRPSIWLAAVAYSGLLWVAAFALFSRMRTRLAYWV
ncbi:ABC transporter permease [Acetobacter sacchari]|uniref:ABC transporter permease n=1 Tax=Acetobacter sacchari TaxID=2661687 RepID=A0ABS3LUK9_9PROT|nr:ABC transporter permease [Acetobacter sacchari]MBO1359593.1 ABC transporter permease [Acetobacter sacchari]